MARVKRAVNAHKKRRVILERAEGYRGQRSRLYRKAKEQVTHSLVYAYRDRRARKGDFRRLWIQRINAASRANGLTYNRLIQGLSLAGIEVDRRILADLAVNEPATFAALVATAKAALPADTSAPKVQRSLTSCLTGGSRCGLMHSIRLRIDSMFDNPRSPRVRAVAKLAKRDARSETGLFLFEGPQAVAEALTFRPRAGRRAVRHADRARAARRHRSGRGRCRRRRRVRHRARARRDGRHGHPAGHRRGVPAVPDLGQGHPAPDADGGPEADRDPRGGARPGQRRHDHPGRGCRGRRRRHPHRPQRRPVQPQGRALVDRVDLPPAGRRRAPSWSRCCERVHAAGLQVLAADIKGDDLLAARSAELLGRADRLAVRQRGPRARPTSSSRSPTARSRCRSTATPSR